MKGAKREENVAVPRANNIEDKDERIQRLILGPSTSDPSSGASVSRHLHSVAGQGQSSRARQGKDSRWAEGCNFKKFPQFRSKLGPNAGKTEWSPSLEMVRVGER